MENKLNFFIFLFSLVISINFSYCNNSFNDFRDHQYQCNIALIEKNCNRGYAFCRYDDRETCSNCKVGTILAQTYKNTYKCVKKELTLCKDEDCINCDEKGDCLKCKDPANISYEGKCVKKTNEIKCNVDNCISCKFSGNKCLFCAENYSLDENIRCIENKDGCSISSKDEMNKILCFDCHINYVMNYDFRGCRKLPES